MDKEKRYFVGGSTIRFPRKIDVINMMKTCGEEAHVPLRARMAPSGDIKHILIYDGESLRHPCGELKADTESDEIYTWFEHHPGAYLPCMTTGKPVAVPANIGTTGFYVAINFNSEPMPSHTQPEPISNVRLRQMLFETLQLLRKVRSESCNSPSDWKDIDDWLFSELDFELGELEEVYAGTGVMVYGGSCYEDGQSPKDYATKYFEAAPGAFVTSAPK